MLGRWCLLIALALLVPLAESKFNPNVCGRCVEPETKPFPNIPNTFTAKFQWNMNIVNQSYYVEEYYSETMNLAVVIVENMIAPGKRSKFISDPEKRQLITILTDNGEYGAECDVADLTSNAFTFNFKTVDGKEHLLSGKSAITLGAESGVMMYNGTTTIDDIDVDVWTGCFYIKEQDLTLNADYYFTLNETGKAPWQTASGMKGMIKRAHLYGNNGDMTHAVDETYEYAYFANTIPLDHVTDLEIYQVSRGSYCMNRKTNKKLPKLPNFFSLMSEVHDPQQDVLTYTDEWYDFTSNMTRIDHEGLENRGLMAIPVKMIHDYKTGLAYTIRKSTGECKIKAIDGTSFDDVIIPGGNKSSIRMRNPKEFFNFDDSSDYPWIYEGGFVERGVTTDAWISKRPYPARGFTEMAYWEWYFTSTGWTISNGDVDETYEPFKLVITRPEQANAQIIYNIYKYNEEPPDDKYFSVEECFDQHNGSRSYEFIIIADVQKYNLDKHAGMLKYWTAAAIEEASHVRGLRMYGLELIFDVKKVFARFTLLGSPKNIPTEIPNAMKQVSLEEAEQNLQAAVKNQLLVIFYLMPDGQTTAFTVEKDSLTRVDYHKKDGQSIYYVISDDGMDNATAPPVVVPAALSSGGAAALAIVMLIVGMAIVGLGYYFLVVRREKKLDNHHTRRLSLSTIDVE